MGLFDRLKKVFRSRHQEPQETDETISKTKSKPETIPKSSKIPPPGAPHENVEHHPKKKKSTRDYHKKVLLRLRVEHHTKQGIQDYCRRRGTNPSNFIQAFISAVLYHKEADYLKELMAHPGVLVKKSRKRAPRVQGPR